MSLENRALVQEAIDEIFNRKKTWLVDVIYAPGCHGHSPHGSFKTRNAIRFLADVYAKAFPDYRIHIQQMIAENDLVAVHYNFEGTNTGTFADLPPTGHRLNVPAIAMSRIANGQIVEQYFMWDNLAAQRQMQVAWPMAA